jgi:hypothetical protein
MIPMRIIHTHGRPPRESERELFLRLAAERRCSRRRERRGELLRGVRRRLVYAIHAERSRLPPWEQPPPKDMGSYRLAISAATRPASSSSESSSGSSGVVWP